MAGENQLRKLQAEMGSLDKADYGRLLALRRERIAEFARLKGGSETVDGKGELRFQLEARAYPVLSVVAPALTTHENKIEFPGDPMCLYNALAYPISQVVSTKEEIEKRLQEFPVEKAGPYNDLCPDWFTLPSSEYRAQVSITPAARYSFSSGQPRNTDQCVFDPRVWNSKVADYFKGLIELFDPRAILVSSVSPAHRYAIEIAKLAKSVDPNILVIFGGRHADETICMENGGIKYAPSSIITAMQNKIVPPVVDFVVSGEGYYVLDFLMKCISISMDMETKKTSKEKVVAALLQNRDGLGKMPGTSVLTYMSASMEPASFQVNGVKTDISTLPLPYDPFAIRARFPVFSSANENGKVGLTAHVNTAHACPFRCHFCSESSAVVGKIVSTRDKEHYKKIVSTYLGYGADAFFFDDSVLCAGDRRRIELLLDAMIEIRKEAEGKLAQMHVNDPSRSKIKRMAHFEWGAQFTIDYLITLNRPERSLALLKKMREAGCSYIYMGIESLAEEVAKDLDKNKRGDGRSWVSKARAALQLAKDAGVRVGASVLFGLPGETSETIKYTIEEIGKIVDDGLLYIVSPNIVTYHPGTRLTKMDGMEAKVDYISMNIETSPPYTFFEEAFRDVVSVRLNEEMIWRIHDETATRWTDTRNMNPMEDVLLPSIKGSARIHVADLSYMPRSEFYSGEGLKLIDQQNYPAEISAFLGHEENIAKRLITENKYEFMVEIGAMDRGFLLQAAVEENASYIGLDLVGGLISKLDEKIDGILSAARQHAGGRIEAHVGDVFELPAVVEKLRIPKRATLAAFPFNSFGNMPDPETVVSKVAEAGLDIAIFTYKTDYTSNSIRADYYSRCNYKDLTMRETADGVLFSSTDGLWSYAYEKKFMEGVFARNGFELLEVPFGEIGVAYVGKLRKRAEGG